MTSNSRSMPYRARFIAVPILILVTPQVWAEPIDQDFFTDFEFITTTLGQPFDVVDGDLIATFSGDAFSGFQGIGELYRSGFYSWMVNAPGTGIITFSTNAAVVEFYARTRSFANDNTIITALDDADTVIGDPVVLTPTLSIDPLELVSFTGNIAKIRVENLATGGATMINGIDDFGFSPIEVDPLPGDFNGDNNVDDQDLPFWQAGFGTASGATIANGDGDLDGDVDGGDYLIWQVNAGSSSSVSGGAAIASVPEPLTAGLLLFAALCIVGQRHLGQR